MLKPQTRSFPVRPGRSRSGWSRFMRCRQPPASPCRPAPDHSPTFRPLPASRSRGSWRCRMIRGWSWARRPPIRNGAGPGAGPGRPRCPCAPELRGAFLFGEGVHGYTKPDGHYMDDLWFYDINSHCWICCYPGADTKTLDLTLNAQGFEAAKDGEPIPVATMGHGYEMTTYDIDQKRFMSMPNSHGYEKKALPQRRRWWKMPPEDASPWLFETASGKWNRLRTGSPGPSSSFGDTLIYLTAERRAFFLHRNSDVWFYDVPGNKWQSVNPQGPKPPFGIDATSCYDSKRHRVYIGGGSYPVAPTGATRSGSTISRPIPGSIPNRRDRPAAARTAIPPRTRSCSTTQSMMWYCWSSIPGSTPRRRGWASTFTTRTRIPGGRSAGCPRQVGEQSQTQERLLRPHLERGHDSHSRRQSG